MRTTFGASRPSSTTLARSSSASRERRGFEFGAHTAAAELTTLARHSLERRIARLTRLDETSLRVMSRIGVVKPLLISQNDEKIRLDEIAYQARKGVVITEHDGLGRNGVIFIDHWHDAELEQMPQGAPRIEIALSITNIVVRQQNLRCVNTILIEAVLEHSGDAHLSHCGDRL